VIDWIERHNSDSVFIESTDGSHTFGEIAEAARSWPPSEVEVVRPRLDVDSIVHLIAAMSAGSAIVLAPDAPDPGPLDPAGAASVVFTSGTTTQPKGVRLTRDNWIAAVEASARHLGHTVEDTWALAMPLHHVGGLSIVLRSAYVGARIRLLPGFDPASFAGALRNGVTLASVVPTMLSRILDADQGPYQGLKAVLVGGGPIPPGLLERATEAGLPVLPTYGLTETCGQVATLRPGSDIEYKAHPLPGVELRIGSGGRIELRGPMVTPGYVGERDRPDGEWLVTGDVGSLDSDGALRVVGRADEVIVSGGENVSPSFVEAALEGSPLVRSAMVVGIPSEEWGMEVGCLYVGEASPRQVIAWARKTLQDFMVPHRWLAVDEIPRTGLGKPDRSIGRSMMESETL